MGYLFDGLGFHVSVAYRCPGRGWADVGFPFRVDRQVSAGCSCHHGTAVQHGVGIVGGCEDILHDCLDAGVAVGRGIGTAVVGFLVRCGWVGWGGCLMLDGRRRWGGRAVVWVIAWRGCRAVLWVDKPVIVAVVGLSERKVVVRDMVVEPSSVMFPWGHIVSARAVVGVVRVVGASLSAAAAVAVTRVL